MRMIYSKGKKYEESENNIKINELYHRIKTGARIMTVQTERRKYPRIVKSMDLKLETEDDAVVAEVINLSASGVLCKVNVNLIPTTNVGIVLPLAYNDGKTESAECFGAVVRTEEIEADKVWHTAIFFNDIQDIERDKIIRFVEKHT